MTKKTSALAEINAILGKSKKGDGKGKKGRKIGRYKTHPSSMRYKAERRWEANRLRRVRRHLRRTPSDAQARRWLAANGTAADAAFLASLPKAG